ncbi:hypothetical protein ACFWWA_09210 [Streptomyces goshikiensis]|uniref:hypothetical protein n=1 Tax=Streptomyces goshikiensis TaxID=1942 RepID=UPI0036647F56
MTTDLGLLTTAADQWESMAAELKKVETRYGDSVQKTTMGRNWSGVSAGVAHTSFAATRYEYAAAQSQAKSTATLLRTAHEALTDPATGPDVGASGPGWPSLPTRRWSACPRSRAYTATSCSRRCTCPCRTSRIRPSGR